MTSDNAAPVQSARVDALAPGGTNPRRSFDKVALEELTASVREHGVLQPVLVRPWPPGKKLPKGIDAAQWEIVAGERRWRAAKAAGLEEIPALVRELTDTEVLEIQVVENLQRTDLHPLEEAEGYRRLVAADYDVAMIAEKIGRSARYVYDRLALLSLTKDAQKAFLAGEFTPGHAVILARLSPEDQARAIEEHGALFTDERPLFTPDEEDDLAADYEPRKPVSVRELQAWVDQHTKLEADQVEQMLLPETFETLKTAAAANEKVVRITYDETTPEEARDGQRVILGRSWRRADGQRGSKQCDHSVNGLVVIGPGRGQALRVCIDKQHCTVHWGDLVKAAKKREREVTAAAKTGEDREQLQRKKEAEARERQKAFEARWAQARPAMLEALAAAVKKLPAGAGGALGKRLLERHALYLGTADQRLLAAAAPPGKSAEDLVRHLAFAELVDDSQRSWNGGKDFIAGAKALGVDLKKILDQVAPPGPEAKCRQCGCTEERACRGGCSWTHAPDPKTGLGLCSACASKAAIAKAGKLVHALHPKPKAKRGKKA